jgi:hypothetical protein
MFEKDSKIGAVSLDAENKPLIVDSPADGTVAVAQDGRACRGDSPTDAPDCAGYFANHRKPVTLLG